MFKFQKILIFSALILIVVGFSCIMFFSSTIHQSEIKCVKMVGGRPGADRKVLFPGRDDENIQKLVLLINKAKKQRAANEQDTVFLGSEARPSGILFMMKNGNEIAVWTYLKSGGIASREEVILNKCIDGVNHYSIIKSKELVSFVTSDFKNIMPLEERFSAYMKSDDKNSKGFRIGASGNGWVYDEVNVYIERSDNTDKKYLIGTVTPVYGKWTFSIAGEEKIKSLDGTDVYIEEGLYVISAEMGVEGYGMSETKFFKRNQYIKDASQGEALCYISKYDMKANTLTFDEIEWVIQGDTSRLNELGLTAADDFPNGYYIYNKTVEAITKNVAGNAELFIINGAEPQKTDKAGLAARINQYQTPYTVTIRDNKIIKIVEQYVP